MYEDPPASSLTSFNTSQHEQVHLPLTVRCYCCKDKFSRYPDMLLHLEQWCLYGVMEQRLNQSAARMYQWNKFIKKDMRRELLDGKGIEKGSDPFQCPTCKNEFVSLSALFQHIWSTACEQSKNGGAIGKLKRWLWKKHARKLRGD